MTGVALAFSVQRTIWGAGSAHCDPTHSARSALCKKPEPIQQASLAMNCCHLKGALQCLPGVNACSVYSSVGLDRQPQNSMQHFQELKLLSPSRISLRFKASSFKKSSTSNSSSSHSEHPMQYVGHGITKSKHLMLMSSRLPVAKHVRNSKSTCWSR